MKQRIRGITRYAIYKFSTCLLTRINSTENENTATCNKNCPENTGGHVRN